MLFKLIIIIFFCFQLTVVVKESECAGTHFVTYQAQTDALPGTFDDGRTQFGPEGSVSLQEIEPGRHIEIRLRYVDTTLVIRQVGRYLTFSARMPELLVNESMTQDPVHMQLCNTGCPRSELIDYKSFLAQHKTRLKDSSDVKTPDVVSSRGPSGLTRDKAEKRCRAVGLMDFYFDSCVFDLLTTGDSNFTVAAYHALHDVQRLVPDMKPLENRTDLAVFDRLYSSARTRTASSFVVVVLLAVCLLTS